MSKAFEVTKLGAAIVAVGLLLSCGGGGAFTWIGNVADSDLRAPLTKQVIQGDIVSIRVFGQDALAVRATVRDNGLVSVPLIGEVQVLGRQTGEISAEITKRLEPFVNQPHVMTVVEETHIKIVMAGEVQRPGTLVLDGPVDVLTAIADAGGLTQFAGEDDIFVLRPVPTGVYRVRFSWDEISRGIGNAGRFRLRDGDQVVVE